MDDKDKRQKNIRPLLDKSFTEVLHGCRIAAAA